MKDSFPPLLRGIGMLVMLTAAVIGFCIARHHDQSRRTRLPVTETATGKRSGDSLVMSASETHELRGEFAQYDLIEHVLESVWFECLGFVGTAIFATSFFVEAYLRHLGVKPTKVALEEDADPAPQLAATNKGLSD